MRKATTKKFSGTLLSATLAVTLAAFGCSSNQYAGNGEPASVMPTINSVNHSGTPGSSSGTEGIPPMSSSYVIPSGPRVNVDALAILAAEQGFRGRVLGPVDPAGYQQGVTISSGQFVSPANQVLPQSTVNSSINSEPTTVITSGEGDGITIAANSSPLAAAAPAAATPAATAATGGLTAATAGTTLASSASFSPALMNSTPAPQATGTTNATLPTLVATGRATPTGGIQILSGANGAIMMTNVANTAPAVKGK
jgi:hypothetical protein